VAAKAVRHALDDSRRRPRGERTPSRSKDAVVANDLRKLIGLEQEGEKPLLEVLAKALDLAELLRLNRVRASHVRQRLAKPRVVEEPEEAVVRAKCAPTCVGRAVGQERIRDPAKSTQMVRQYRIVSLSRKRGGRKSLIDSPR